MRRGKMKGISFILVLFFVSSFFIGNVSAKHLEVENLTSDECYFLLGAYPDEAKDYLPWEERIQRKISAAPVEDRPLLRRIQRQLNELKKRELVFQDLLKKHRYIFSSGNENVDLNEADLNYKLAEEKASQPVDYVWISVMFFELAQAKVDGIKGATEVETQSLKEAAVADFNQKVKDLRLKAAKFAVGEATPSPEYFYLARFYRAYDFGREKENYSRAKSGSRTTEDFFYLWFFAKTMNDIYFSDLDGELNQIIEDAEKVATSTADFMFLRQMADGKSEAGQKDSQKFFQRAQNCMVTVLDYRLVWEKLPSDLEKKSLFKEVWSEII